MCLKPRWIVIIQVDLSSLLHLFILTCVIMFVPLSPVSHFLLLHDINVPEHTSFLNTNTVMDAQMDVSVFSV